MTNATEHYPNSFAELFRMFTIASSHLKYPKIRFTASTGEKVQLYLATKGYIAIKVNGTYVGKLQNENHFVIYGSNGVPSGLQSEIFSFCLTPLTSAVVKGLAFSQCCFCGLELTNKYSLQAGYGPICAENYGLPHGSDVGIELDDNTLVDL